MIALLDSPLDNKNIGLAKNLWALRQNLDIYCIISANADKLPSGKTFFGFIQNESLSSICLEVCKIYELEKGHELNSINGVLNTLQNEQIGAINPDKLIEFIEKYGAPLNPDCHICSLKSAVLAFHQKHSKDLAQFRAQRNKRVAHSEYNIKSKSLPSYDTMEQLFLFGDDFHNLVSSVFIGAGTIDLKESPIKRSFLMLLKNLGMQNIQTDMDSE